MGDFNQAITLTLKEEGGFNRNLGDDAGMTYRGLTEKYDPDWGGWLWLKEWIRKNGYPKEETIFPELEDSVKAYYKLEYWPMAKGDQLTNDDVTNFVFDFVVHSGKARREVNKAINKAMGSSVVTVENELSQDSVYYLNNYASQIYPYIVQQRKDYLSSLPLFSRYGDSWLNRIANFPSEILQVITGSDNQKKNTICYNRGIGDLRNCGNGDLV